MKMNMKRLTAILMALLLSLTGLTALAEVPNALTAQQKVYERGNSLKSEANIQLNTQAIMGLAAMFGGGQMDENTSMIIQTAASALSKLNFSMVANMSGGSFLVGSKDGELLKGQVSFGTDGGEAAFAADLVPGFKLIYPPSMAKGFQASMEMNKNLAQIQALIVPYGAIVDKHVQSALQQGKAEAGPFEVAGVGSYDSRVTLEATDAMLKGLVTELGDTFVKDTQMQALVAQFVQSVPQQPDMAGAPDVDILKNPEELNKKWEEAKQDMAKDADAEPKSFGTAVYYQGTDKSYLEFEVKDPQSGTKPMLLTLQSDGNDKAGTMKLGALVQTKAPSTTEAAVVDWASVKQGVLSGENPSAMLILVEAKGNNDADNSSMTSDVAIEAHVQRMRIGLNMDNATSFKDKFSSNGKFSVSFMGTEPLLTVTYRNEEVATAPEKMADDLKAIQMTDGEVPIAEADAQEIGMAAMEKGLPGLIQKLKIALPEEGQILAAMLTAMLQGGQTMPQ